MQPSNEKKYALQQEAIAISNSPKEGKLQDHTKSRQIQDPIELTLVVSDASSKMKKGKRFAVCIKFLIAIPNPKTRTFIDGQQWYCGNLTIAADPVLGTCAETRGFVLEVLSRTGMVSRRGTAFGLVPNFTLDNKSDDDGEYKDFFEIE